MNPESSPTSSTAWHPESNVSEAAFDYLARGFSVIPIHHGDKRPLLAWREFKARRPTEAEVVSWLRRWPDAGVAIVCGAVSGLAVVDLDPRNGDGPQALVDRLPRTPTVETGGGGRHCYFRLPPGARVAKVPALLAGVDLQADGSYVVAPPSEHATGRRYCWLPGLALGEVPLAPLLPLLSPLISCRLREEERSWARMPIAVSELSIETVLAALQNVRRCGRGWIARCPAHDDRAPSLSIGQGEGGRLLLHCFAGCSFGEIRSALRERLP